MRGGERRGGGPLAGTRAGRADAPPAGRRGPGSAARPVLAASAVLAAAALVLGSATDAAAQEEDEVRGDDEILVEAPRPFRLAASGSALLWEDAPTRSPDDGSLWGLELERLLLRWAYARLGGAFGRSTIHDAARSADVNTYLFEVLVGPRLSLDELLRAGVIPYAGVGIGTVVHDPRADGLASRSQNAFAWGGGVEWSPRPSFGVRAEWRHYSADLEDIFADIDRTGEARDADRIEIALFWAF